MRHRSFYILFVYFLVISPSIAEDKALPFELLGKELKDIRPQLRSVTFDPIFDDYGTMYRRWFVIDKDRCYLTLGTVDDTISVMYIKDPCYSTRKNIRVGDSFSKVRAAYPDAKFRAGQDGAAMGVYDLITNDGKIAFWFNGYEIRQMIEEGQQIEVEDEIVQKLELSLMKIGTEPVVH